MKSSAQPRANARNVVAMDDHALSTLQFMRASMEAAGSLTVPGLAGIVMGSIGITACALAMLPRLSEHWLLIWIVAAVCAVPMGGASMFRRSGALGRAGGARMLRSGAVRRFILCLAPALLAGAVLTYVLWSKAQLSLIPGVWLLLYGCGIIAAATATLPIVSAMGALFVLLGVVALLVPGEWSNVLLGAGFGGLHLIFGIAIGRLSHVR